MEFNYNQDFSSLINVMKTKGEKKNLKIKTENKKVEISLMPEKFTNGEDSIPVTFKGEIGESEKGTSLKGKFTYGFYLYTMVIVAAALIIARLGWSIYKMQKYPVMLCIAAVVLLGIVILVVNNKGNIAKKIIVEFLEDLNRR